MKNLCYYRRANFVVKKEVVSIVARDKYVRFMRVLEGNDMDVTKTKGLRV